MKVTGICVISKNPANGNLKMEFAKTRESGDLVKGSIYWLNSSKKDEKKTYSNIRFVAYKDMVNFFRNNCNEMIEITNAILKSYSGDRKDGTKYYGHEIVIFEAGVYQKKEPMQSFHDAEKVESDSTMNEDIPY